MGDADPMEVLMSLLRPEAVLPKVISGGGRWSVRKPRFGGPAFCLMLEGSCRLDADGLDTVELGAGDFLLLPQTPGFTLGADRDITPTPSALDHSRHTRHGAESDAVTMRMLGGYFRFDPANAALLVALLPPSILVRADRPGAQRLHRLVELITEEADADGACRDVILQRLVEVLLIEAMRVHTATDLGVPQRGLIAGLTDPVLAPALRRLHADVGHGWTVERLAREAAVSRAVFAQRFTRTIGVPPMQYLLEWRVALAKDLLRRERPSVAQVAQQVGYQSATAFTTAFARVAGCSPTEFARTASHRQDVAFAGGDRAVQ
ncbi:AraC family transcriptional regulator [Mycolicibacterium vaccae]|uniref:Helix-turn-helix domain-containing protein n=2 Tax=Mycolicibacterium vaccae TaxID=1810 RepID=K0V9N3_MYCVA|nr:AraC family transcriptional regulator [Mycolicibacterium vaccae]EJZ07754.1 helix-turn-helix domain-containing protein [Mycolicibacterium vaccae ATCC 25954]